MACALSILDKSPIPGGASAGEALARTVALARRAGDLGFRLRYANQALHAFHDKTTKPGFDSAREELNRCRGGPPPATHPRSKALPKPDIASMPDRIPPGASPNRPALAARLDWDFRHAGASSQIERISAAYRPASRRRPQLALFAVAAPTREGVEPRPFERRAAISCKPSSRSPAIGCKAR